MDTLSPRFSFELIHLIVVITCLLKRDSFDIFLNTTSTGSGITIA